MTANISRRRLIESSIVGTAALAGATSAFASKPVAKWDETVDIIVVGSGFAGLAAAIEAKNAGANVIVLEKMAVFGGNSAINGGILTATGCPQQKLHGIKDSVDLLEKDILAAGNYMNYVDKVRFMAERALSNYEWTVNYLGVEYLPDAIGQEGGHSVPRYVTTKNGSGSGIVSKEIDKCKELGIPLRNRVFVERIIRGEDGRVEGLEVREGYRFPREDSGKTKFIRATAASRPTLRTVCIRIPSLTKRLIRRTSRAQRLSSGVKPQPSALFRFKTTGFSAARGAARVKRAWALAGCSIKRLPLNMVFG